MGALSVCGMVSQYNLEQPEGVHNLMHLVQKRIHMEGFLVYYFFHLFPKYLDMVLPYIKQGKIVYVEDIAEARAEPCRRLRWAVAQVKKLIPT